MRVASSMRIPRTGALLRRLSRPFGSAAATAPIVVVGSVNADVIVDVDRLPTAGECLLSSSATTRMIPGGKGANQAVAAARLAGGARPVQFVCQFGNDSHAAVLEAALVDNGVDVSKCGRSVDHPSGQGFVFLQPDGGLSSIVVGGSNANWAPSTTNAMAQHVAGAAALMLQREVPEHVNEAAAAAAAAAGVPVLQDVGGEDRPMSDALLSLVEYVMPNLSELTRLTGKPTGTAAEVEAAARSLQARGARNVLVTLGSDGALLLDRNGAMLRQGVCAVPGGVVVDETGAGDSFRAAFTVALVEGRPPDQALQLAAAAGAIAVSRLGAIPSLPGRNETARLADDEAATVDAAPPPAHTPAATAAPAPPGGDDEPACWQFASRLNSMKDRRDLCDAALPNDVLGWVARQAQVTGLTMVDFNYPQHLPAAGVTVAQARDALAAAGLRAGAVCLRYPATEFRRGALTHPDAAVRQRAIDLTIEAGDAAATLGAGELVVWSAYCGYDYALQVDHRALWRRVVDGFRQVCDAHPQLKVSLEFKPTDENTRYFAVPSTGAALRLVDEVARPNMGLTLDFGHCLMAGENPAQSVAMVGDRLFGVQCNDGYGRLGAEDGLMFGSVNPRMALEFCLWLQKIDFKGHIYFDTFPGVVDPVLEAEYNIKRFKQLWRQAERLRAEGLDSCLERHDALGALEMLDEN